MVHDHLKGLRLDRRVLARRGWLTGAELEKELAALPDAAGKIDESEPEGDSGQTPSEKPAETGV